MSRDELFQYRISAPRVASKRPIAARGPGTVRSGFQLLVPAHETFQFQYGISLRPELVTVTVAISARPSPLKSAIVRRAIVFVNAGRSGVQLPVALHETCHWPPATPTTSVLPSPLKSPNPRSATRKLESCVRVKALLPP